MTGSGSVRELDLLGLGSWRSAAAKHLVIFSLAGSGLLHWPVGFPGGIFYRSLWPFFAENNMSSAFKCTGADGFQCVSLFLCDYFSMEVFLPFVDAALAVPALKSGFSK